MKTVGVNSGCDGSCQQIIEELQEKIKTLELELNNKKSNNGELNLNDKELAKFKQLGGVEWLKNRLKFVKLDEV